MRDEEDQFEDKTNTLVKTCPYCNILLLLEEYGDHIYCHEIEKIENMNNSNNVNNNQEQQKKKGLIKGIVGKVGNFFEKHIKLPINNQNEENQNKIDINFVIQKSKEIKDNVVKPFFQKVTNYVKNVVSRNNDDDENSNEGNDNQNRDINLNERNIIGDEELDDFNDDLLFYNEIENENHNDNGNIKQYIPVSTVKEKRSQFDNNSKCIICLAEFQIGENESILPCLHIFHQECLYKWIENKKWCPICKFELSMKNLSGQNTAQP